MKVHELIKESEKIQEKIDDADASMIAMYREFKGNDESLILGEREVSRIENQLLSMEKQANQTSVEVQQIEEEIKGLFNKVEVCFVYVIGSSSPRPS